jgi:hypothetical protein
MVKKEQLMFYYMTCHATENFLSTKHILITETCCYSSGLIVSTGI